MRWCWPPPACIGSVSCRRTPSSVTPAIGQGALALESRPGAVAERVAAIEHRPSRQAVDAERAFLTAVGGTCVTPLAAHATIAGDRLTLRALIAHPDGTRIVRGTDAGGAADGARIGRQLGERLLRDGGAELLRELGLAQ
jgi:hydroxymethylbilane synthase